ncbi:MAG: family containing protein [Chitinophagaceae bacterium]|nr:family containing protein [Chitinophagaceae bacterium]
MKIKNGLLLAIALFPLSTTLVAFYSKPAEKDIYEIKVYRMKTNDQVTQVDNFLKNAYLPALHRLGVSSIGVFKNAGIDTALEKSIYVWIPLRSLEQLNRIEDGLAKDISYNNDGAAYLAVPFNAPAYTRIETIILRAFNKMPHFQHPSLMGDPAERIYELRSYEATSEKLYKQKVHMFNEGDEIGLFNRLGFNAVFYAEVLAGSHMPNLMYMTSFDNRASRDEHWKNFGADPEWKRLSALPEYQHTVSKADILFLHPAAYSEL